MITASDFEKLFRSHFDQLYRLAYSMLGDAEDSRDVVHEVYAQLWETQPQIEPDKTKEYLVRATYNRSLNLIKRKGKLDAIKESYLNELKFSMQADRFDWEKWSQIQDFIQSELPPRTKQAMDLCFGEEKSYKEAAAQMGVGIEAINKHIVTGLRLLREKFLNKDK